MQNPYRMSSQSWIYLYDLDANFWIFQDERKSTKMFRWIGEVLPQFENIHKIGNNNRKRRIILDQDNASFPMKHQTTDY